MVQTGNDRLELGDGRVLDIYTSGPEDAPVFLFHHGTPSARIPFRVMERSVHEHGFRLVTWSRPGYGGSTRKPGRSIADVVPDAQAVLDAVGADRALVLGLSGGGPHALACGARMPDRVTAVISAAGVGPFGGEGLDFLAGMGKGNIVEFGNALQGEAVLRAALEAELAEMSDATPEDVIAGMSSILPEVDRGFLSGEVGEDLAANFKEALRQGVDGWVDDDLAFVSPWGFELGEISVPVHIWQGTADLMVPFGHGSWLAANVPAAVAHLEEGEGHISLGVGAIDCMIESAIA